MTIKRTTLHRLGLIIGALGIAFGATTLAVADPADPMCEGGEHGHGEKGFEAKDKNGDGFLTKDEVGEHRWERLKVADANKDGKVSKAELQQAHKDGKLGHKKGHKGPARS